MSTPIRAHALAPTGENATPAAIAAAITTALLEAEDKAKAHGLRPVWDTLQIETETQFIDRSTLFQDDVDELHRFKIAVLAVSPAEIS